VALLRGQSETLGVYASRFGASWVTTCFKLLPSQALTKCYKALNASSVSLNDCGVLVRM